VLLGKGSGPGAGSDAQLVGGARLVLPAGCARDELLVGLQVIGPFPEDRTAIDVAADIAEPTDGFVPPPGYRVEPPTSCALGVGDS
jgi:hypothetical protein